MGLIAGGCRKANDVVSKSAEQTSKFDTYTKDILHGDTLFWTVSVDQYDARPFTQNVGQSINITPLAADVTYAHQALNINAPYFPPFMEGKPMPSAVGPHQIAIVPDAGQVPDHSSFEQRGDNYANGEDTIYIESFQNPNNNPQKATKFYYRKDGGDFANVIITTPIGNDTVDVKFLAVKTQVQNLVTMQQQNFQGNVGYLGAAQIIHDMRQGQKVIVGANMRANTIFAAAPKNGVAFTGHVY
jgi:hypothetical protein